MKQQMIQIGSIVTEDNLLSSLSRNSDYTTWLQSLDAILVLGGGVPLSPTEPPTYVQRRCDVAAQIFDFLSKSNQSRDQKRLGRDKIETNLPSILCLSAGTAHVPQYINPNDGLPLWEATASATYLMNHPVYPVPEEYVFVETTSYDTISNAYFARTTMTDVAGWSKLLIVTNEFHIHRSKAIFDWIFSVPSTDNSINPASYELYYLSCNNVGLAEDALQVRRAHESRGDANVKTKLAPKYKTLKGVWEFLTSNHDFFSASKLAKRGVTQLENGEGNLLNLSYGATTKKGGNTGVIDYRNGNIILSFDIRNFVLLLLLFLGLTFLLKHHQRKNDIIGKANGVKKK